MSLLSFDSFVALEINDAADEFEAWVLYLPVEFLCGSYVAGLLLSTTKKFGTEGCKDRESFYFFSNDG